MWACSVIKVSGDEHISPFVSEWSWCATWLLVLLCSEMGTIHFCLSWAFPCMKERPNFSYVPLTHGTGMCGEERKHGV